MIKLISWNVNGFRAVLNKGFSDFFEAQQADVFCIQETKMQNDQVDTSFEGYTQYFNSAIKKGYSGTAVFTRKEPLKVDLGIGISEHDNEGRVITAEFDKFYLVNCYTPNSQNELKRLDYRMEWERDFRNYLVELDRKKPVILCGDLNVAHKEIDLKNPKSNKKNAGFTNEEREKMTELLEAGFIDSYRHFYPEKTGAYTWWSYIRNARGTNAGWRIDYFVVSQKLKNNMQDALIYSDIFGSDHCPVGLILDI